MKNIQFIAWFAAFILLFTAIVGTFVYAVDPLQLYRKSAYEPLFTKQERYQNPGLAKNYAYDTIILGSSMTENFVPSQVGKVLGGKVMKLSMEGSTAKEQRMIADVAIKTGQVKKVLWGIDYFSFRDDSVRGEETFPYYLYDESKLNDYKYLFNISNVKHALGVLYLPKAMLPELRTLDMLNNWDASAVYGAKRVLAKREEARLSEQMTSETEPSLDIVKKSFDRNTISLMKAHPEIEFIVYFPPYSILRQQLWYSINPERFNNQLEMKKYMFEQFSALSNVTVHDFQNDSSITYNLDEFKDLSHHSADINRFIVEEIAAGSHLVTAENVELNNRQLQEQVNSLVVGESGQIYSIAININGEPVMFKELPPADSDQVSVPLKDFADAAGIEFTYDAGSKNVSLSYGEQELSLGVGDQTAKVNGESTSLDIPAKIYKNRVNGPLIQIIQLLRGEVEITKDEPDSHLVTYNITLD
ncbi:copper amine oxidase N-terminal domain-containing protein [Paenibacillus puldeungensis]|uniref:Copper amine oxidase N-terminal domain-containing protein n=1 Tax=Paenibacillus puldeungensis TaxID=696536 RepID=A0ABW3S3U7_9BACL